MKMPERREINNQLLKLLSNITLYERLQESPYLGEADRALAHTMQQGARALYRNLKAGAEEQGWKRP